MREIRTSSSMRGCRKRATAQRACALLYRSPWLYLEHINGVFPQRFLKLCGVVKRKNDDRRLKQVTR